MSYDLAVWEGNRPADDKAAGTEYERLYYRYIGSRQLHRRPRGLRHTSARCSTGIRRTTPQKGKTARGQVARSSDAHQALSCTSPWCTASVTMHLLGRPR